MHIFFPDKDGSLPKEVSPTLSTWPSLNKYPRGKLCKHFAQRLGHSSPFSKVLRTALRAVAITKMNRIYGTNYNTRWPMRKAPGDPQVGAVDTPTNSSWGFVAGGAGGDPVLPPTRPGTTGPGPPRLTRTPPEPSCQRCGTTSPDKPRCLLASSLSRPEPWQPRDVRVQGAAGAAVAPSVVAHAAARAGARREEPLPRATPRSPNLPGARVLCSEERGAAAVRAQG